jgi:hypothetical protein
MMLHMKEICEGIDVVVLPTEGRDCMGCLPDHVKMTRALNKELDEAMKEIRQLGDLGEEASRRITELECLWKKQEEAVEKVKKENATLEGMIRSHDELIMETATETRFDRMGEDDDEYDSDDEDDDDTGGDALEPPAAAAPELIVVDEEEDPEEMVLKQEAPKALEVILPDEEPEPP